MGRKSISRKWGRRRIWLPKLLKTNQVSTMQENIVYRHKITFFSRLLQTKKDDALTSHDMMTPRCR